MDALNAAARASLKSGYSRGCFDFDVRIFKGLEKRRGLRIHLAIAGIRMGIPWRSPFREPFFYIDGKRQGEGMQAFCLQACPHIRHRRLVLNRGK
ncbi:hypothetical protein D3C87_1651320 [compost metagenome]